MTKLDDLKALIEYYKEEKDFFTEENISFRELTNLQFNNETLFEDEEELDEE